MSGVLNVCSSNSFLKLRAAPSIKLQCEATLTFNCKHLFAPASLHLSAAIVAASSVPAITT